MKKYVQIVLPALVAALLACPSAQAQSLKDLLNRDNVEKLVGAVTGVNLAEMTGTWVYTGAAVEFESDNLLAKAGGAVAANTLAGKLDEQLQKLGFREGTLSFTFEADSTFQATLGGKPVKGTYTYDQVENRVTLKLARLVPLKATLKYTSAQMDLLFNFDRLLDLVQLLAGKSGKRTLLVLTDDKGKNEYEQEVIPTSSGAVGNLLYKRWVERRREMTEKYSGGRVGYVHVKAMNSESFRDVFSEVLGKNRNKEALVVDIRHNGGGWLHDDLGILLSGKLYQTFEPRGQYIGSDPFMQWYKPSAVLMCENDYSNAHGFPFMYKALGIGQLVGAPMAGTMTAVWWETQVNGRIVVGLPEVAVKDMSGKYLENQDLYPDVIVYQTPEERLKDNDVQLKKTIDTLLGK